MHKSTVASSYEQERSASAAKEAGRHELLGQSQPEEEEEESSVRLVAWRKNGVS